MTQMFIVVFLFGCAISMSVYVLFCLCDSESNWKAGVEFRIELCVHGKLKLTPILALMSTSFGKMSTFLLFTRSAGHELKT